MNRQNGNVLINYKKPEELIGIEANENLFNRNINDYINKELDRIKFSSIYKHAIVSFAALILSFSLDLSTVPLLGDISINISKQLFPTWQPLNQTVQPISFWWLPIIAYIIFMLFAYKTYKELRKALKNIISSEVIDRIVGASISVIDGISTALPLIGAAILLISIKLGPEIFLGLSVPFEIKALVVLAIGKLFEPVLDEMVVEFQNISSKVAEMRSQFHMDLQLQALKESLRGNGNGNSWDLNALSLPSALNDLEKFELSLQRTSKYSEQILSNLKQSSEFVTKIESAGVNLEDKITEVKELTIKMIEAANSFKDERTIIALKSLEAIINRDGKK